MSEKTTIQWADSTVNFWSGCTKVSDGCKNCYAEKMDNRHLIEPVSHWGKDAPRLKSVGAVKMALALNRRPFVCNRCGSDKMWFGSDGRIECKSCEYEEHDVHRRRVFSLSRGDWLDPEVPIEWLAEMLDTIRQCDQVQWLLVTKRPELWKQRMVDCAEKVQDAFVAKWLGGDPPANVMVLTSVENQKAADERIPELLKIPASRRGLSCEPLLGPVDLALNGTVPKDISPRYQHVANMLHWVIAGCESGPGRRNGASYYVQATHLMEQCKAAGVPFFHKQMPIGNRVSGDMAEWLKDLQVREFPEVCA